MCSESNRITRAEGLEIQLEILLEMQESAELGQEILICTRCFNSKDDCVCSARILWPIQHVIARLRWMLGHS